MADNRTDLEIRITTIADQAGIKLTADGLQRVKERTQELSAAYEKNSRSTSGVTDEMKQQAQQALRNISATEKVAKATQNLDKDLGALKQAGQGVSAVFGGLLTGDFGRVSQGLLTIGKAASGASPFVEALFAQFARGAAAASVVAGPVLVLIGAMKMAANDAETAMKRWWAESAAGAEAYKQKSAEVKAAAAADLAVMLASVQRLAAAYSDLIARMDAAEKRSKTLAAAEKELALAKASTPEEKAAIEQAFASKGIADDMTNADLRARNSEDIRSQARQDVRDAEAGVSNAQAGYDNAVSAAAAYAPVSTGRYDRKGNEVFAPSTSAAAIQARAAAKAAGDALAAAKSNLDQVQTSASGIFKSTQADIDNAALTKEVGEIKLQTISVNSAKSRPGSSSPGSSSSGGSGSIDDRKAAISAGSFNGSISPQAAADAMKKLNAEAATLNKVITAGATAAAATMADTSKKVKLIQQSGPGGG